MKKNYNSLFSLCQMLMMSGVGFWYPVFLIKDSRLFFYFF